MISSTPVDITVRPDSYKYHHPDGIDTIKIAPGRYVIDIEGIEWEYRTPEECMNTDSLGRWYKDNKSGTEYLLCQGCGIDCT